MFSQKYSKSFRDSFFLRTSPVATFALSFSIRRFFFKKKVNGEISFVLINLFQVQIQEPASRSTTMRAFVFLAKFTESYYHKIFETFVWMNVAPVASL